MTVKKPTSARIFVDTNILIYLYSYDESYKRGAVEGLLNFSNYHVVMSTQVINEFISVMRKKRLTVFSTLIKTIEECYSYFNIARVRLRTIKAAVNIAEKYKYSYFDSLMIASAIEKKCTVLYSEDMHDGQVIEGRLRIQNPFIMLPYQVEASSLEYL